MWAGSLERGLEEDWAGSLVLAGLFEWDSLVEIARCLWLLRATHARGRDEARRAAHAGVRIFEGASGPGSGGDGRSKMWV